MYDVITIGTATRDIFLQSPEFKRVKDSEHLKKMGFKSGEAGCFAIGSKIELENFYTAFGGGAANSAVTFARQKFKTAALVKIGDDDIGKRLVAHLRKEGITPFVVKDTKQKTAYSTILLLPSGERTILVYRGASEKLKQSEIPFEKLKSRWVYIVPSQIPFSLMMRIVHSLKRRGTKIAINPSRHYIAMGIHKLKSLFAYIDVVIMNREEASYLTGVDYADERTIFRKLDKLIDGIAAMTEGPKGALVSDGRYLYRAGIYKEKQVVDRTGAGDAFGSGFVAGLMKEQDITYALKLASANAASVVEQIGAQEGILTKRGFLERRFKYLDLDIEPLL